MILLWKSFKINLDKFNKFLINEIPSADGINADLNSFEIVEKVPFQQEDVDKVTFYYNSLSEETENEAFNEPPQTHILKNIKDSLVLKKYDDLTILERKFLFNIELTPEELDYLLNNY